MEPVAVAASARAPAAGIVEQDDVVLPAARAEAGPPEPVEREMAKGRTAAAMEWTIALIAAGPASAADRIADLPTTIERWGVYEVRLTGPADGNPYADVKLSASFRQAATCLDSPHLAGQNRSCSGSLGQDGAWEGSTYRVGRKHPASKHRSPA